MLKSIRYVYLLDLTIKKLALCIHTCYNISERAGNVMEKAIRDEERFYTVLVKQPLKRPPVSAPGSASNTRKR